MERHSTNQFPAKPSTCCMINFSWKEKKRTYYSLLTDNTAGSNTPFNSHFRGLEQRLHALPHILLSRDLGRNEKHHDIVQRGKQWLSMLSCKFYHTSLTKSKQSFPFSNKLKPFPFHPSPHSFQAIYL